MVLDYRPSATGTEAAANAARCMRGHLWFNGMMLQGVVYADTEAGVVGVLARDIDGRVYRMPAEDYLIVHFMRGEVVIVEPDGTRHGPPSFVEMPRGARVYDLEDAP